MSGKESLGQTDMTTHWPIITITDICDIGHLAIGHRSSVITAAIAEVSAIRGVSPPTPECSLDWPREAAGRSLGWSNYKYPSTS